MHRENRLGARSDALGHTLGVEVERLRVDVGEHRRRADSGDRLGRRVERESRADDLVSLSDPERLEYEDDRVRSVSDPYGLAYPEVTRGLLLERLDVRTEDELPFLEHVVDRRLELREERRVLRLHVDEGDLLHHSRRV